MRQKKRIDVFDFSGDYPELENIDIDARRKKRVEFYLTGNYPVLESINYEGTFGSFDGEFTGNFPNLSFINIVCTDCAMNFDLNGAWKKNCEINVGGVKEDILIKLPSNIAVIVNTKVGLRGRVFTTGLKKKHSLGIFRKTYMNDLVGSSDSLLTLNVATVDGRIILESETSQRPDETGS